MSTHNASTAPAAPAAAAAPPAKTNPLRLILLLVILAAAIGILAYDYRVAGPGCEAGEKTIQDFVDARNKLGVKEGALVTAEEIRKEIGMQPTKVEKNDEYNYTVEYYCWWGNMPILNLRRHYIAVVYTGDEPRHFSSAHRNSSPPSDALPIPEASPPGDDEPLPMPQSNTDAPKSGEGAEPPAATDDSKASATEGKAESPAP